MSDNSSIDVGTGVSAAGLIGFLTLGIKQIVQWAQQRGEDQAEEKRIRRIDNRDVAAVERTAWQDRALAAEKREKDYEDRAREAIAEANNRYTLEREDRIKLQGEYNHVIKELNDTKALLNEALRDVRALQERVDDLETQIARKKKRTTNATRRTRATNQRGNAAGIANEAHSSDS